MSEKEFWWASVDGGEPQVVEVFEGVFGGRYAFATGNDCEFDLDKVRLIERVQPPAAGSDASPWQKIAGDDVDPIPWTEKVELGDCRYRAERTPYLLELMKRLGDPAVTKTVTSMLPRVGFTRTMMDDDGGVA